MSEDLPAIRGLIVYVVQNGLIVRPRETHYMEGGETDAYVFSTVEQMVEWMVKQVWAFPSKTDGSGG